ncbi:4-coumarate--CoA ligase 1 isoform X2 [Cimex lectularius]|nr:4-coumarate--CoA ligase 1 isoform X2 [Cimex lectularius]
MPNMPEFPVCFLGILEAGLTLTAINPTYRAEEIVNQMNDSSSRFIIVHYNMLEVILQVKNHFKNHLDIICVNDFDGKTRELPSGVRPFSDLIQNNIDVSKLDKQKHKIDINESIAFLPYSSGTTGLPKGVCLSHQNLTSNVAQMCIKEINTIQETTKTHQDTIIGVLPFFHIYGTQVVLVRSLREGSKIVTLPKFDPKQFVNILENNKNIVLYAVPPIILFMASHPSVTSKTLENLRFTGSGGAPCGSTDIERLLTKRDHQIVQAYGMTEASPVLTHSVPDSPCKASVGYCVSNTFVKIVDIETGKTLGPRETGELCFKGPQIMKGYLNKPEATAETIDKDGWLHTGDLGYVDEKGCCFIVDRKKELIKVKGFQVPPAELEAVLRQHPSLCDAGVVGHPCSKAGEVPVAFVVVKQGVERPKEDAIKNFVADKVAPYKQIKHIIFTEVIPKNASGKILRKQLKELIKTELKKEEN